MKPIKQLAVPEYMAIRSQAIELLEQLQNHHIAVAMNGSSNIEELNSQRASELVLRSMKVGLTNGIDNYTNIVYMVDKQQQAIEYLEGK